MCQALSYMLGAHQQAKRQKIPAVMEFTLQLKDPEYEEKTSFQKANYVIFRRISVARRNGAE